MEPQETPCSPLPCNATLYFVERRKKMEESNHDCCNRRSGHAQYCNRFVKNTFVSVIVFIVFSTTFTLPALPLGFLLGLPLLPLCLLLRSLPFMLPLLLLSSLTLRKFVRRNGACWNWRLFTGIAIYCRLGCNGRSREDVGGASGFGEGFCSRAVNSVGGISGAGVEVCIFCTPFGGCVFIGTAVFLEESMLINTASNEDSGV